MSDVGPFLGRDQAGTDQNETIRRGHSLSVFFGTYFPFLFLKGTEKNSCEIATLSYGSEIVVKNFESKALRDWSNCSDSLSESNEVICSRLLAWSWPGTTSFSVGVFCTSLGGQEYEWVWKIEEFLMDKSDTVSLWSHLSPCWVAVIC